MSGQAVMESIGFEVADLCGAIETRRGEQQGAHPATEETRTGWCEDLRKAAVALVLSGTVEEQAEQTVQSIAAVSLDVWTRLEAWDGRLTKDSVPLDGDKRLWVRTLAERILDGVATAWFEGVRGVRRGFSLSIQERNWLVCQAMFPGRKPKELTVSERDDRVYPVSDKIYKLLLRLGVCDKSPVGGGLLPVGYFPPKAESKPAPDPVRTTADLMRAYRSKMRRG